MQEAAWRKSRFWKGWEMVLFGVRDRLARWLVKKLFGLGKRYPIRRARRTTALGVLLVLLLPLLMMLIFLYLPFLVADTGGRDVVPDLVHWMFLLLLVMELVFAGLQIKQFFGMVDMIYQPAKALEEGLVRTMTGILKSSLKMGATAVLLLFFAGLSLMIYSMLTLGPSAVVLLATMVLVLLSLSVIGVTFLVYFTLKSLLIFLVEKVWKRIDDRMDLEERMKEYHDNMVIDVELV